MKFFSASCVFPVGTAPIPNGIVAVTERGEIVDVFNPLEASLEQQAIASHPNLQVFQGFITPGFVNAHCHLELSHVKEKIKPGEGLDQFIRNIEKTRKAGDEEIKEAIANAEYEMIRNGIIGVGDISNGKNSFSQKMKQNIHYHTFIEVFSFKSSFADAAFQHALSLWDAFHDALASIQQTAYNSVSISPHAPYSASAELLKKIALHATQNQSVISMHNQENEDENLFFKEKKGNIPDRLAYFNVDISDWQPTGKSSLQSALQYFSSDSPILLVHNTVTPIEDKLWAEKHSKQLHWCFCPGANLYIENRLPDFSVFAGSDHCILGTDSLASNTGLSILEEIKHIRKGSSVFSFEDLLRFATLNGAKALGFQAQLGSIEKGKHPGLNLLSHVDIEKLDIQDSTQVKNLLI